MQRFHGATSPLYFPLALCLFDARHPKPYSHYPASADHRHRTHRRTNNGDPNLHNTHSEPTGTATPTGTMTSVLTSTPLPVSFTPTFTATPFTAVNAIILSCNTSLDISHGMGEVTNAYVTIQNTGNTDLIDICATLNALDEGRAHPDKTKCVASLPAGYQVTEKLTVDLTLGKSTPIQVDILSADRLLQRTGQNACTNFELLPSEHKQSGNGHAHANAISSWGYTKSRPTEF